MSYFPKDRDPRELSLYKYSTGAYAKGSFIAEKLSRVVSSPGGYRAPKRHKEKS